VTCAAPKGEPLAHSARGEGLAQTYRAHISEVRRQAVKNAEAATHFYGGNRKAFIAAVTQASTYHDLGKLDEANQQVLRRKSREALPVAHEDAGVALLLGRALHEAAVLVAGHHAGLFSQSDEMAKRDRLLRNLQVADHVDKYLERYESAHRATMEEDLPATTDGGSVQRCGLTRRLALSCLVDADHGNTAAHYGGEVDAVPPCRQWAKRLGCLDAYVASLPPGKTAAQRRRNVLRRKVYDACREAEIGPRLRACEAPVGSGKTTAIMAHLLRVAIERQLRHIIVVLPFTNIIRQSVQVYRNALVLPGEHPEKVIAEHHHQADFDNLDLRQLATLWRAPIVVTTAVQFFETLASNIPARLRKLHELPGSAVFVDEAHAAVPSHLWPQIWQWLETLTATWGGHVVLASGSLPRFWKLKEFVDPPKRACEVPDIVPTGLRDDLQRMEHQRIQARQKTNPLTCDELIAWVWEHPGPRLVILNTVQSAAVVADRMRGAGHDVLHLSTALAPIHRNRVVKRVEDRLKHDYTDWALVATSCVEAGMNFSFRIGFRESFSAASLVQVGGRVSREAEHRDAVVWDFRLRDLLAKDRPGMEVPRRVLDALFEENRFEDGKSSVRDVIQEAMRREITDGMESRAKEICRAERAMEYPSVATLCRVIDSDTCIVVVDHALAARLRQREKVRPLVLLRHSVQLWASTMARLPVAPLFPETVHTRALYEWTAAYDPDFLGYMAGVLPQVYGHGYQNLII